MTPQPLRAAPAATVPEFLCVSQGSVKLLPGSERLCKPAGPATFTVISVRQHDGRPACLLTTAGTGC